jgi:hypothetical protein
VATINLKDAYFYVPIHPLARKFLRFWWKGVLYQFMALPFGLSPAPKVFTSLTKRLKAKLGRLGIRTIFYLDDILVLGTNYTICMDNYLTALSMLMKAGFIVNWEKSSLSLTTHFKFLGMIWDSNEKRSACPRRNYCLNRAKPRHYVKYVSKSP